MKSGKCAICEKESKGLWLLNLAQIDSLKLIEGKNVRQSVCEDCAGKINEAVSVLNKADVTSMKKAFDKAGVKPTDNKKERPVATKPNGSRQKSDIQNDFLSKIIKDKSLVQLDAVEGIGWRGFIKKYDNFSIIVEGESGDREELIFKHAVKSIKPV